MPPLDEIADKVFQLESSSGKNDKCVREGRGFNGYGFGQSLTKYNCYDSYKSVRKVVRNWFDEKLATMSLTEALCYYNSGHRVKDCKYSRDYQSL